ncbi:four-carbon acid sugar kinase family protein [Metabacillus sediminilitoris]|uniref:Hrp-dependent type III effector protein n=1 Tax=Metabacillus sediminilitoris TaxID=2567941 RepID=A0A4S4BUN6_9BACI|nr:four-carbon acid sugar kinase family protein [Metabacillus sediminilitoris]QGQ45028.1 Hrp-dependent type III effector protein [Metabacillus sediminilitoris]THF78660.1 Hrp-dependent type III effector protein [Metabacillus sediminilitoris]
MKLAVIADDLTGANDTGVQFAKQDLNTTVLFSDTKLQPTHLSEDVIVLNSDSRALISEKAYDVVFNLSTQLKNLDITKVFKKIDSTMRGNIGPEIDAVMDVFNYKTSFIVPAFPKSKRITMNGMHYVNGVLLEETEIANDPACPVKESYLPKLLKNQSKREVELISIDDVRKGKDHLSEKMIALSSGKDSKIIIVDATTDEELKTIVEAAESTHENFLWVGSAGIAYHLTNSSHREEQLCKTLEGERLPVLVVAGSVNSITHRQIQHLKEKKNVEEIVISPEEFFYEDRRKLEINRIVKAGQALLEKGDLVVTTNRERETINRVKDLQKKLGLTNFEVGNTIAQSMGVIAGQLIESKNICGAILTGGDIAGATCKVLNGDGIRVIGEVEAGIPYGKLFGGLYDGIPLVTKAGAFGTEQALSKALQTITEVNAHVENSDWRKTNYS